MLNAPLKKISTLPVITFVESADQLLMIDVSDYKKAKLVSVDVVSNGIPGRTILNGAGAPSVGLGIDGDFYYDPNATRMYGPKLNDLWGTGVSFQGPQGVIGPTGATGSQGIQGIQGIQGPIGNTGSQGIPGVVQTLTASGTFLTVNSADPANVIISANTGTTVTTLALGNVVLTLFDVKGDLLVGTGADTFARLVAGTNDFPLVADSTLSTGLKYAPLTATGIAADAVTTAKILDSNVTLAKMADNSVGTAELVDLNVTTGKIAADAVTTAKILDSNVTTAKILDSNVTVAKIGGAGAKGDLLTNTAANAAAWLSVGANNAVLVGASGQSTGLQWQDRAPVHVLHIPSGIVDATTGGTYVDWITLGNVTVPTWATSVSVVMAANGFYEETAASNFYTVRVKLGTIVASDTPLQQFTVMQVRGNTTWPMVLNGISTGAQSLVIQAARSAGTGKVRADTGSRFYAQLIFS